MRDTTTMTVLLATDFSRRCLDVSRVIAALAGTCRVNVSLVHVIDTTADATAARRALSACLPRLSEYGHCERLLVRSHDAARAVGELCRAKAFDFVIAPASETPRLARPFTRSFRADLLRHSSVPLWTGNACLRPGTARRPLASIACLVDFDGEPAALVRHVADFARRVGARVQAFCAIPAVHDGTIANARQAEMPLSEDEARERIAALLGEHGIANADITVVEHRRSLRRSLLRCDADLLFVESGTAANVAASRFSYAMDTLDLPLVCVGHASSRSASWSLETIGPFRKWPEAIAEPLAAVARRLGLT